MTGKNVVVILGSPRKNGNSEILAEKVISGAKVDGARISTFRLQDMNISPCDACGACQTRESSGCIVKDDMQTIYQNLKEADIIVIASPIYWFSVFCLHIPVTDAAYQNQYSQTHCVDRHLCPGNGLCGQRSCEFYRRPSGRIKCIQCRNSDRKSLDGDNGSPTETDTVQYLSASDCRGHHGCHIMDFQKVSTVV